MMNFIHRNLKIVALLFVVTSVLCGSLDAYVGIETLRRRCAELIVELDGNTQNTVRAITDKIRQIQTLVGDMSEYLQAKSGVPVPEIRANVLEQQANLRLLEVHYLSNMRQRLQEEQQRIQEEQQRIQEGLVQQDRRLANVFEAFVGQANRGELDVNLMEEQNFETEVVGFLLDLQALNAQIECPVCLDVKGRDECIIFACHEEHRLCLGCLSQFIWVNREECPLCRGDIWVK